MFDTTVNGAQITVAFHVENLSITSQSQARIHEVIAKLCKEFTAIILNTEVNHTYHGMHFDFSKRGKLRTTMDGYINDAINRYGVTKSAKTSITADLFINDPNSPTSTQWYSTLVLSSY